MKEEADNLKWAKMETNEEARKVAKALYAASLLQQCLQEDRESTLKSSIQNIVNS